MRTQQSLKSLREKKTGNWLQGEVEKDAMGEIQEEKKLISLKVES